MNSPKLDMTAHQTDLFGYFKSGSIREVGNFDFFNATAFSYTSGVSAP